MENSMDTIKILKQICQPYTAQISTTNKKIIKSLNKKVIQCSLKNTLNYKSKQ